MSKNLTDYDNGIFFSKSSPLFLYLIKHTLGWLVGQLPFVLSITFFHVLEASSRRYLTI